MTTTPTAVRLTGTPPLTLSRWLWLVKMFLAIPHFVVLAVLGAAFIVTSLAACVAVLATGRYPRPLFDFNVGVLRWSWRVGFYVYAALGTDKYPPFRLGAADYPAELEIAYPTQLSRRLVLAKWPLAVPHLAIVGLIGADLLVYPIGSGAYSILNLLVVIAGSFLLITGTYPRPLFELLLGVNRWIYRVIAYVAFLTDEYPPFRLDAGEELTPRA